MLGHEDLIKRRLFIFGVESRISRKRSNNDEPGSGELVKRECLLLSGSRRSEVEE